jgi:hypothetical protein
MRRRAPLAPARSPSCRAVVLVTLGTSSPRRASTLVVRGVDFTPPASGSVSGFTARRSVPQRVSASGRESTPRCAGRGRDGATGEHGDRREDDAEQNATHLNLKPDVASPPPRRPPDLGTAADEVRRSLLRPPSAGAAAIRGRRAAGSCPVLRSGIAVRDPPPGEAKAESGGHRGAIPGSSWKDRESVRAPPPHRPTASRITRATSAPEKFCWPVTRLPSRTANGLKSPAWM